MLLGVLFAWELWLGKSLTCGEGSYFVQNLEGSVYMQSFGRDQGSTKASLQDVRCKVMVYLKDANRAAISQTHVLFYERLGHAVMLCESSPSQATKFVQQSG